MSISRSDPQNYDTNKHGKILFTDEQSQEIADRYQRRASSTELAEDFGVTRPTILRCLRENNCEIRQGGTYIKRNIPNPWEDVDAAYVFAVLIGDASIEYNNWKKPVNIQLETPDCQFGEVLSKAAESAFGIQARDHTGEEYSYVQINSIDLGKAYDRFSWRTEKWRIPEPFFDAPEDIKVALCQGKLDSDGSADRGAIVLGSIHKSGLTDIRKIVHSIGFDTTLCFSSRKRKNRRDYWKLRILEASPELFRLPWKRKELEEY